MSRIRPLTARTIRFSADLYSVGIVRYVDVPLSAATFSEVYVPVHATCNGVPFRGTLLPRGGERHRLALNAVVRQKAGGVDTGDRVIITLRRSAPHPVPALPNELERALARVPGARLAFESWPPGRRREVLQWLTAAKGADTRSRRVRRLLERLGK